MFPSKDMMDYMAEINRLFPKTNENELQPTSIFNSTYSQSPIYSTYANRSSSSADSTSPESYPDLFTSFRQQSSDLFSIRSSETPQQSYTSPLFIRPQRPIVGRKILGNTEYSQTSPVNRSSDHDFPISSPWMDVTSNKSTLLNQSNPMRSYELFPTDKSSPTTSFMATTPNLSPIASNFSPTKSNLSPAASNFSPMQSNLSTASNFSPVKSNLSNASNFLMASGIMDFTPTSPKLLPSYTTPQLLSEFQPHSYSVGSTSKIDEIATPKMCKFCRRNGETPSVYMTHCVKERIGKKHIVTCPILRSHVCSTCGASGDYAHTISYCPILRSSNNGKRLESTTITLKNTRVKSNGKRRY